LWNSEYPLKKFYRLVFYEFEDEGKNIRIQFIRKKVANDAEIYGAFNVKNFIRFLFGFPKNFLSFEIHEFFLFLVLMLA
jgi:hypothetical protein